MESVGQHCGRQTRKLNPEQEPRHRMLFLPTQSPTGWSRGLACSMLGSWLPATVGHSCTHWPGPVTPLHRPLPPLPTLEGTASRFVGKAHRRPTSQSLAGGLGMPGVQDQGHPGGSWGPSRGPSRAWHSGSGPPSLLSACWVEMKSLQFGARLACM